MRKFSKSTLDFVDTILGMSKTSALIGLAWGALVSLGDATSHEIVQNVYGMALFSLAGGLMLKIACDAFIKPVGHEIAD